MKTLFRSKRIEWAGHLWRDNGIFNQLLMGGNQRTKAYRPPQTKYMDGHIKSRFGIGCTRVENNENRERWREILEAAIALKWL